MKTNKILMLSAFALLLGNAVYAVEKTEIKNVKTKILRNALGAATIGVNICSYLAPDKTRKRAEELVTPIKMFKDVGLKINLLIETPAFLHDVISAALDNEPNALMMVRKLAEAVLEGQQYTSKDKSWHSSEKKQIALAITIALITEMAQRIVTKKIKGLKHSSSLTKKALRASYQAATATLIEGILKPTFQNQKPSILGGEDLFGKEVTVPMVALAQSIRAFAVEILGTCLQYAMKIETEDAALLDQAIAQLPVESTK